MLLVLWTVWRRWDRCSGQRRAGGIYPAGQRSSGGGHQRLLHTEGERVSELCCQAFFLFYSLYQQWNVCHNFGTTTITHLCMVCGSVFWGLKTWVQKNFLWWGKKMRKMRKRRRWRRLSWRLQRRSGTVKPSSVSSMISLCSIAPLLRLLALGLEKGRAYKREVQTP